MNTEMVITNRSSFVFPRISFTQARSCHSKRRKTSQGHVGGEGHPQQRRQMGWGSWLGTAGLSAARLVQLPPRLPACLPACTSLEIARLCKGLTPAALKARGDERLTTVPQRLLCPVLSLKFCTTHSRVQPGVYLPL